MFLRTPKFSKNNRSSDGTPIAVPSRSEPIKQFQYQKVAQFVSRSVHGKRSALSPLPEDTTKDVDDASFGDRVPYIMNPTYNIYVQGLPPELVPLLSAVPAEDVPIAAQSTAPVSVGTSMETCSFASTNNKDLPVHSLEPEWTKRFTKSRGTDNPNDHFLPTPTSGNQFLPPRTSDNLTTDAHIYKKTPPSTQKRSGRGSHVPSKTGTLDHRSTFDNTLSPATAPICGEDEHETQMRSFNEKFNRLLFNIDLSGNGLNGEEPKKPRGSQQLTNGDYEEHLEVCLAIASKNKQALAPLRERLQAKFYDIASSYTVRTGKTPTGVEVLQLLRGGKLMVRQRDVFRAIHECHAVRAKHAKQNASMEVVKERYGNITRQMVNTFIDMCPTCLRRPPVIKPLKGAARPIYSNNFRDRFQIDLIDMQDKPKRDDRGVICAIKNFWFHRQPESVPY
ncbi:hypothetical protein IV203_038633 [Nitzschia inconspicua]|uniref:Integrase zinc-binding domain-containing protein n=1 Tax=Nitzschia inconspicua TaxID=303405 RepID=A0A9K3Q205_9STRA|nr:hypothetical protein IV203_038633 [Nitzschia inconspicua]